MRGNKGMKDRKEKSLTNRQRVAIKKTVCIVVGFAVGITIALPFVWMLFCSFYGEAGDLFQSPPRLPDRLHFENYALAAEKMQLYVLLGNTLKIVICNMVLVLISSILVGYGFARFQAYGKNICFTILLSTMMLPWVITMVPAYMLFSDFNMIGTHLPLILPAIGGNAFYVFILRQYFRGMPVELDDAAKIDGCNSFQTLVIIHLPNCLPVLMTVVIFSFNAAWGDYVGPSIYILKEEMYTLSLGLQRLKTSNYTAPPWHLLMAGCVMFSLPMVLIFLFAQKAFIKGVVTSGLK